MTEEREKDETLMLLWMWWRYFFILGF